MPLHSCDFPQQPETASGRSHGLHTGLSRQASWYSTCFTRLSVNIFDIATNMRSMRDLLIEP